MTAGLEPQQYAMRCKLEKARKRILRGGGRVAEVFIAAKAAGWPDGAVFLNAFYKCFGDYPDEHRTKTRKLWKDFAHTVARI